MRFVIQKVSESEVKVDGETLGKIGKGFMVLIGVSNSDTKEIADRMIKKMLGLRIFEDEQGKTNLSLDTVGGSLLLISQFTLYANCKKGNRPSFIEAGAPDMAEEMYEYIIAKCKEQVPTVERGRFGADMKVSLVNDGPFTIILDSETLYIEEMGDGGFLEIPRPPFPKTECRKGLDGYEKIIWGFLKPYTGQRSQMPIRKATNHMTMTERS